MINLLSFYIFNHIGIDFNNKNLSITTTVGENFSNPFNLQLSLGLSALIVCKRLIL